MNTIIKPKSRKAWLAEREQGIGSSEVGTMGIILKMPSAASIRMRQARTSSSRVKVIG